MSIRQWLIPVIDYDGRMAEVYDSARTLPLEALDAWRIALAPYLPPPDDLPVLDLGSGTGFFSNALTEWFETGVVGVEPAEGMRRQAARKTTHGKVAYVGGKAEAIPLADGCCGCAWLSTVIHHISDLHACAREMRRVLHPTGPILIRTRFAGRCDDVDLFRFFPEAKAVAEQWWPDVEGTIDAFATAGFRAESLDSVREVTAPSLAAYCEIVRLRADSTLEFLGNDDFARGKRALEAAAARETAPRPIIDRFDLLVLR